MTHDEIVSILSWGFVGFGAVVTVGAYWFAYSLWKYDRKQELIELKRQRRRRKRRRR